MSQKELKRLHIIRKAIDKRIKQREAAEILKLSQRQIRRLVRRVRQESNKGIIHRLRGAKSHRAIAEAIKQRALGLCRGIYTGFNPTFASEKLFERNKIKISRETLRQWFIAEGIPYEKRKARPHRRWRQRKAHCGEMVQMDGSHHDWFEGRGPECVLMGYIDDATGKPFARFHTYEGTLPAMDSFKRYIKKYGIPQSVYLDKHTTYKSTGKPSIEDELNNIAPLSQFERALEELSVEVMHANSPQAKGRIERLFKTFQHRFIREMRLKGIKTVEEANRFLDYYLPVYAKRFGVMPAEEGDFHRSISNGVDLDRILCVKTERALRNDFTIAHNKKLYQILDNMRAGKITVEERTDGSMIMRYKDAILKFKEITTRPKKEEPKKTYEFRVRKTYVPPKDHPWRGFKINPTGIALPTPIEEGANPQYSHYEQKEKVGQKEKELLLTLQT